MEALQKENAQLRQAARGTARLREQQGETVKQMRALKDEAQAAREEAECARRDTAAAQRQAKEQVSRAAMTRQHARLREERASASAEGVQRLHATVQVLHSQLLSALQVRFVVMLLCFWRLSEPSRGYARVSRLEDITPSRRMSHSEPAYHCAGAPHAAVICAAGALCSRTFVHLARVSPLEDITCGEVLNLHPLRA